MSRRIARVVVAAAALLPASASADVRHPDLHGTVTVDQVDDVTVTGLGGDITRTTGHARVVYRFDGSARPTEFDPLLTLRAAATLVDYTRTVTYDLDVVNAHECSTTTVTGPDPTRPRVTTAPWQFRGGAQNRFTGRAEAHWQLIPTPRVPWYRLHQVDGCDRPGDFTLEQPLTAVATVGITRPLVSAAGSLRPVALPEPLVFRRQGDGSWRSRGSVTRPARVSTGSRAITVSWDLRGANPTHECLLPARRQWFNARPSDVTALLRRAGFRPRVLQRQVFSTRVAVGRVLNVITRPYLQQEQAPCEAVAEVQVRA